MKAEDLGPYLKQPHVAEEQFKALREKGLI